MTRVEGQLGELLGLVRGQHATGARSPAALDRTQVEEITRRELERGHQDQAAREAEAAAENRLKGIETKVAQLAEVKPRQPTRRITKLFWPGHDRD
jgi:hypothetical protein